MPKIQSDSLLNTTYSSPLSPIYQKHNDFSTPQNNHTPQKYTEKISPLCLNDFIIKTPVVKRKFKRGHSVNETGRRITPTCLNKEKVDDIRITSNCFNNFNIKEVTVTNHNKDRSFFLEERQKILSKRQLNENNMTVLSRKLKAITSLKPDVEAIRAFVSNENALNNLAEIYITILNNSLVLNITSEIYFLITLLIKVEFSKMEEQQNDDFQNSFYILDDNVKDEVDMRSNGVTSHFNFFKTIHNIIYFVVKCLESQIDVLKYYDKTTLILLSNNNRLRTFSIQFSEQLKKMSEIKSDGILKLTNDLQQTNVCFNLDTDNRDNFPSDVTFNSFRKQRDVFYEVLRIWEINHLQPGWNFSVGLGGKIKSLLNLQSDPTNFVHFCRLFKDQLLSTCGRCHKVSNFFVKAMHFMLWQMLSAFL